MQNQKDINNRNNLRIENQEQVISLLRQFGSLSIVSMAEKLGLSFPAVSNIVDELTSNEVLSVSKEKPEKGKKGRKPLSFSLNDQAGVTAAIDLSSNNLVVALFDLNDKLICKENIPHVEFIEKKHFEQISEIIACLLKRQEVKGRKLLGIAIASPGMINAHTGDYAMAYRIKNYAQFNPQNYFSNLFNVPTKLYNDVRVGALAEKLFGSVPQGMRNFVYMHIGSSSGLALFLNGKLYSGINGYSGEISVYNPVDDISKNCRHNKLYSLRRLYAKIAEEKSIDHKEFDMDQLLVWQKEKDPVAVRCIEESAKYNALAIIGYADLLDLEGVILEGPIVALGEEYRSLLLKYINLYDAHEVRVRLLFSGLQQNNNLLGAAYLANSLHFSKVIGEITKKRLSRDESVGSSQELEEACSFFKNH